MPRKRALSDSDGDSSSPSPKRSKLLTPSLPRPQSPAPTPTPLTQANLQSWTAASSASASSSAEQLSSSTRSASSKTEPLSSVDSDQMPPSSNASGASQIDDIDKLRAYRVFIHDTGSEIPDPLMSHIRAVVKKVRATTPSGRLVAQKQRHTIHRRETESISLLARDLIWYTREDNTEDARIRWEPNANMGRSYSPAAPNALVALQFGSFTQPQPDKAVGYVPQARVDDGSEDALFGADEEDQVITPGRLIKGLNFPFLTAQFKSQKGSDGMYQAKCQGARDGANVVNHLHALFQEARGTVPSVVDICHFSITSDFDTTRLWVHWREDKNGAPFHYMAPVAKAWVEGEDEDEELEREHTDIERWRKYVRNIYEYALGARLQNIQRAVALLHAKRLREAEAAGTAKALEKSLKRTRSTRSLQSQTI